MNLRVFLACALFLPSLVWAETEPSNADNDSGRQETTSEQEWESGGIIPDGGITFSTGPMTPISQFPDRKPYDQALQELTQAQDLLKNGKFQAASDVALQAYDDLMSLHLGRRKKKYRQKLRQDRHAAATVYVDASIAYIADYVKRNGGGPVVTKEGLARLGDLREVAQNYPELMRKLNAATDGYRVDTSTSTKP